MGDVGLVFTRLPLCELSLSDAPWGPLSGGLGPWSQRSHSQGSGPDLWSGPNIPPVVCYGVAAAAAAESLQACPTLCDPIDGSPPGSPVPGIPQARALEWVAVSLPNA